MTRRAARVDANQPAIVAGLRQVGALVQPLHMVGGGVPDLLVGFRGALYLLELKEPGKGGALTDAEFTWHQQWAAYEVHVVETLFEALAAIGALPGRPLA
jgi:hypothetical protein